ncbi:MAG: sigma 54-interacting transcriptional regulator [Acidobacteriota bacterium]|nr:sigma 54-interacting transcriptional regulator [Blastocatellia bacterium]MDW8412825.1 sigma 54-interacting transcriptional regulator [Acidobacteriota bacterium]
MTSWYRAIDNSRSRDATSLAAVAAAEVALESGDYHQLVKLVSDFLKEGVADFEALILLKCLLNDALCELSKYDEAAEVLLVHEQDLDLLPDGLKAELLLRIGSTCSWLGQHPKAIAKINEAIRLFTLLGNTEGFTRGYFELSRLYININEYSIARDYLQKALIQAEAMGNPRLTAQILLRLGMVAHYEGNFAEAKVHYSRALKMVEGSREYRLLGSLQMDLANTLFFEERGAAEQIVQLYEAAASNFEKLSNYDAMAVCYNNLGDSLLRFGKWDRALQVLQEAVRICREHGLGEGLALTTLGELKLRCGEMSEARRLLVSAIKLLDDKSALAHAKRMLGYTYELSNPAALRNFNSSLQLALSVGDHNEITFSQLALAEYFFTRKDYEQSEVYLKQAQERLSSKPAPYISGFLQRLTGLLRSAAGDLTAAVQHVTSSVSIFTTVGDRYELARSHLTLAELLVNTDTERANTHLVQAREILRDLEAKGEKERLARLEGALKARPKLGLIVPAAYRTSDVLLLRRLTQGCITTEVLLQEFASIVQETLQLRSLTIFQKSDVGSELVLARGSGASLNSKSGALGFTLELPNSVSYEICLDPIRELTDIESERLELLVEFLRVTLENCYLRSAAVTSVTQKALSSSDCSMLIEGFVYSSSVMHRVVEQIRKIRTSDVTVLITGESGTGKELVARAIHAESSRREGPFVAFNCTATPRELIESQLFGHRRGSFTGATSDYLGVIRTAKGGTLFLDEIGDLSLEVQPKLLRFLEAGEIQPLGEGRPLKVDVRVIAATNADLAVAVAEKRFREDLYHRLNIIRIHIPPLRERPSEIPMLLNYYLDYFCSRYGRKKRIVFSDAALEVLKNYHWPGNVRQLRNEVERLFTYSCDGEVISATALSPEIRQSSIHPVPSKGHVERFEPEHKLKHIEPRKLRDVIQPIERELILEAFRRNKGNFTKAAEELGLSRRGLRIKIENLGIELPSD